MTFHNEAQVRALLRSLEVESFIHEEGTRLTVLRGILPWHMFSVIAKKR